MLLKNRHGLGFRILLVLSALALFILGYQWGNQYQRRGAEPPSIQGVLLRPPGDIPGFELRDPFGRTLSQKMLADGWTLMGFGDLSQASGQRAAQRLIDVFNRLADQTQARQSLRLILVTTRDTPGLARDFARLSPALQVLGGDASEVDRLRHALGVEDETQPTLFLFGPGAYLLALFPASETSQAIAEDLKAMVANASALLPENP